MTTDTSERGLERLICTALTGAPCNPGRHIRERGFDKQYYLDLILALIQEYGPVSRKDVDDVLLAKLPDRLTPEQKKTKVRNLLQELARKGSIQNQGTRSHPRWRLRKAAGD